ncbi:hypothetical protein ACFO4N_06220 [Camelliibacillus cellulosilyticus]|uniref:HSP20 family molecular chaperone IbpA n=1 Tax=Camelliibacillus cellulosilyticus TaxID=2174486 RepID=A0ABV9GNX1_9BACL
MFPFFNSDQIQSFMENLQKPMSQGFPFNAENLQKYVAQSIDQFMPDFIKNAYSGQRQTQANAKPNYQVFEMHDFVIARVPTSMDGLTPRLYMDTRNLYISGLEEYPEQLVIPLPVPIKPKFAKAEYKNGILEVRMLKRGPEPMTEINIDELHGG